MTARLQGDMLYQSPDKYLKYKYLLNKSAYISLHGVV